jgi:hypothetical protein
MGEEGRSGQPWRTLQVSSCTCTEEEEEDDRFGRLRWARDRLVRPKLVGSVFFLLFFYSFFVIFSNFIQISTKLS